jgi:hypothetical protein
VNELSHRELSQLSGWDQRIELARAAYEQALGFGAEILIGVELTGGQPRPPGLFAFKLTSGAVIETRSVIIATGLHYVRLDAPDVEERLGAGVYYGVASNEAVFHRDGNVFVVGGANSAGQAALHLAGYARRVTLVVRGDSLAARMSRYLVDRLERTPNVAVRTQTEVVGAEGDGRLERLVLSEHGSGDQTTVAADALFILIGGQASHRRLRGLAASRRARLPPHRARRARERRSKQPVRHSSVIPSSSSPAYPESLWPATSAGSRRSESPRPSAKARWRSSSFTSSSPPVAVREPDGRARLGRMPYEPAAATIDR